MNILLVCLLIITVIPVVLALSSIPIRIKQFGRLDIQNPRLQGEQLTGSGQRLEFAQKNAWEALTLFVAALAAATMAGVNPAELHTPAFIFVGARIVHAVAYTFNFALLRFSVFFIAFASCLWIFKIAIGAL